jgi:hypothetical protein
MNSFFKKNFNSFDNDHEPIALVGVKSIDVAIHKLVRMLIIFVSFTSKLPGILFLIPAIVNAHFPQSLSILPNPYLSRLFSFYFLVVALFIFLCIGLYFVSEQPQQREWLCRYLDAPEIIYPLSFDEEKERDIAEKGFTFKYLGNERDHIMRVICVPIAFVCLSTSVWQSIATCIFGL